MDKKAEKLVVNLAITEDTLMYIIGCLDKVSGTRKVANELEVALKTARYMKVKGSEKDLNQVTLDDATEEILSEE